MQVHSGATLQGNGRKADMALRTSLGNCSQFSDMAGGGAGRADSLFPRQNLQPSPIIPSDPRLYNQMTFLQWDQAWPGLYPRCPSTMITAAT